MKLARSVYHGQLSGSAKFQFDDGFDDVTRSKNRAKFKSSTTKPIFILGIRPIAQNVRLFKGYLDSITYVPCRFFRKKSLMRPDDGGHFEKL